MSRNSRKMVKNTIKSISKAKFIEVVEEVLKEKVKKGADNDIDD